MPKKTAQRSKIKGWKATQSTVKTKKQTKLALIILGCILLILSFSQIVKFVNNLFKPFNQDIVSKRTYSWDAGSNINIVVRGSSAGIFSYNPNDKKISIINVPDQTYINVPGGYGDWEVRSIYKFGETLEKQIGDELLKKSMSELLGIPMDGYIGIVGSETMTPKQVIEKIRQGPIGFLSSVKNIKTDLSLIELIKLSYGMSKVRFDKVNPVELDKLNVLEFQKLPDGTGVLVPDYVRLDNVLQSFYEPDIVSERVNVAVFNATLIPGLAQKASRMITNMGGDVIVSTNAEIDRETTLVLPAENSSEIEKTATYKKLVKIFGSSGIISEMNDSQIKNSRAKINVILGRDFVDY